MARRDAAPPPDDTGPRRQLAALGDLLERRGYVTDGLAILAADGGFIVNGLRSPERGAAYALAQETATITAAELAAALRRLGAARPG